MKYKLISFGTLLVIVIICVVANNRVVSITSNRVDQHLASKVVDNCDDTEFCTTLPIVSIDTNNQDIPGLDKGESTIDATIKIYNNETVSNRLSDNPTNEEKILIRYRGNSSLTFDKHQYLIKFVKEDDSEKKVSVLGMPKDNKWVLNGPYLDKTLIRNYLAYNISGKIMDDTPEVRYCEVYLNGNYQGVYLMVQSISRSLTGVTKYKPRWSNGMSSYIIRMDRDDSSNINITTFGKNTNKIISGNIMNVIYPSESDLKPNILQYITDDFSKFEKMLYSYDYKDYADYIDVDSFVDYMVINEYFKNTDAGTHSTYFYKDVRGKIHIGPVWDFNNMANNYIEEEYSHKDFSFTEKTYYNMLLKDEKFVDKVIARYRELRKSYLSDEYIQNYINQTVEYLGPAIDRNFAVWGYSFDARNNMLKPYSRNYHNYQDALDQLKEFLTRRGEWLDDNIETLKQYSHYSVNKGYEGD